MFDLRFEFKAGGVHLPALGLWLDAHRPQVTPERVFVSHAHSDHIAMHEEVILSAATARLMQSRLEGSRWEHVLRFGERKNFTAPGGEFFLTLLPAGHIFGSAMSLIEAGGERLLYTGDFKLRPGRSAERCEPRPADILIMETTFGRPRYVFPPTQSVVDGVVRFCREALENDETPVLLGYSLGKSQEVLCGLSEAGLPIVLHGSVLKITQIYEQFGQCFPKYEPYEAGIARGKVLICPPQVVQSAMLRNLGKTRTAILTGWAVDQNCRYRYRCDAGFPLSDHADYNDLVEMVRQVAPKKVYTLHGFAAEFAQSLRALGYDAQALSEDEQLSFNLADAPISTPAMIETASGSSAQQAGSSESSAAPPLVALKVSPDAFRRFADSCARIGADSSKLEKVRLLAEYLRTLDSGAVAAPATWFSGRPFSASQNKVLQVGWAVLRDAICAAGRVDEPAFHHVYLKHSDLGETAHEILEQHPAREPLSVSEVEALFRKLHAAKGPLAKTPLLRNALEKCGPLEAKYLVKIITGDLRIGLKEGLVEEAVGAAFNRPAEAVRRAHLLVGDVGEVARLASEDRLAEATVVPFRPIRLMLASPEETAAGVWERMMAKPASGSDPIRSVWVEDKYDGIRCQLHKEGRRVALYSRDLKEITTTFSEVADAVRRADRDFILDGEILAMRGEQVLPFAELQRRLGRKEGDLFMQVEVPIQYVGFDLLWLDGQSCLDRPLRERRQKLEELTTGRPGLRTAWMIQACSSAEIDSAFAAARERGNEGLIIKDPESVYSPGRRGLAWLKLKRPLATLDCVVVGAEYGHGKRSKVLSDYTFAVRDEGSGDLKTIGKAYSGLTDAEIANLTQYFLKRATRQHGRYFAVPPEVVLEIAFDRIQISNRHNSGLAMRFPRIVRIRTDKPVEEIDTVATAQRLVAR